MARKIEEFNSKYKFNWFCMRDREGRNIGVVLELESVFLEQEEALIRKCMVVSQNEYGLVSAPVAIGAMRQYKAMLKPQGISILKETTADDTQYINGILDGVKPLIEDGLRTAPEQDHPYYQAMAYRLYYPTLSNELGKRDTDSELRANSAYKW
jgi:hypothetical protein